MPVRAASSGSGAASSFCHLCGQRLVGRYFQYSHGLAVCAACEGTRPRCVQCNVPLADAALERLRAAPRDEPRLCDTCLHAAPRCAACDQPIVGTFYTFDEPLPLAAPRQFCERCMRHRPRCDVCRVPVPSSARPLDDGQYRCGVCAAEMVRDERAVREVYDAVVAAFGRVVGAALRERPRLEVVSRLRMGEVRRAYERLKPGGEPASVAGHHVLGFFVRSQGTTTIYVERALPRSLLLGTLAHELGHAWQSERAPQLTDPLVCEGFAEWVAHHVLIASGHQQSAARATRRDDVYGRGLRRMLDIERRSGRAAVLTFAVAPV